MPDAPPVLSIVGERVALGPLYRALVPTIWRWENDIWLNAHTGDPVLSLPLESFEAEYEKYAKAEARTSVRFVIFERESMRAIGRCGLGSLDHMHRTAELGIGIGEPDCRGKGYGTEATRLLLDYGFNALGLHNVLLRVCSFNEAAIAVYRKAGFREIGRRRECHRLGDRVFDEILMDCLAAEFEGETVRAQLP